MEDSSNKIPGASFSFSCKSQESGLGSSEDSLSQSTNQSSLGFATSAMEKEPDRNSNKSPHSSLSRSKRLMEIFSEVNSESNTRQRLDPPAKDHSRLSENSKLVRCSSSSQITSPSSEPEEYQPFPDSQSHDETGHIPSVINSVHDPCRVPVQLPSFSSDKESDGTSRDESPQLTPISRSKKLIEMFLLNNSENNTLLTPDCPFDDPPRASKPETGEVLGSCSDNQATLLLSSKDSDSLSDYSNRTSHSFDTKTQKHPDDFETEALKRDDLQNTHSIDINTYEEHSHPFSITEKDKNSAVVKQINQVKTFIEPSTSRAGRIFDLISKDNSESHNTKTTSAELNVSDSKIDAKMHSDRSNQTDSGDSALEVFARSVAEKGDYKEQFNGHDSRVGLRKSAEHNTEGVEQGSIGYDTQYVTEPNPVNSTVLVDKKTASSKSQILSYKPHVKMKSGNLSNKIASGSSKQVPGDEKIGNAQVNSSTAVEKIGILSKLFNVEQDYDIPEVSNLSSTTLSTKVENTDWVLKTKHNKNIRSEKGNSALHIQNKKMARAPTELNGDVNLQDISSKPLIIELNSSTGIRNVLLNEPRNQPKVMAKDFSTNSPGKKKKPDVLSSLFGFGYNGTLSKNQVSDSAKPETADILKKFFGECDIDRKQWFNFGHASGLPGNSPPSLQCHELEQNWMSTKVANCRELEKEWLEPENPSMTTNEPGHSKEGEKGVSVNLMDSEMPAVVSSVLKGIFSESDCCSEAMSEDQDYVMSDSFDPEIEQKRERMSVLKTLNIVTGKASDGKWEVEPQKSVIKVGGNELKGQSSNGNPEKDQSKRPSQRSHGKVIVDEHFGVIQKGSEHIFLGSGSRKKELKRLCRKARLTSQPYSEETVSNIRNCGNIVKLNEDTNKSKEKEVLNSASDLKEVVATIVNNEDVSQHEKDSSEIEEMMKQLNLLEVRCIID